MAEAQQTAQQPIVTERVVTREVKEPANGPGMATNPEKPDEHHFLSTDGRKINAFGEEKGSPEDKKRFA